MIAGEKCVASWYWFGKTMTLAVGIGEIMVLLYRCQSWKGSGVLCL